MPWDMMRSRIEIEMVPQSVAASSRGPRILSGIQPSGRLHLGNYYGALHQFIRLQSEGEALYFIANLHALSTVRDGQSLRENTLEAALAYLSLGLDPATAILFRQSDVPEITGAFSPTALSVLARSQARS
jgi:tryptophanyl-tRNA synthetase